MASKSRIHSQILDLYELVVTQGSGANGESAEDKVVVDLIFDDPDSNVLATLEAMGLEHGAQVGRMISGLLPVGQIGALEKMDGFLGAYPAAMTTNVGRVTSQGDRAMNSDLARTDFGVDGTDISIGILSDSYDRLGGASAGVANGDLPPGVVVLEEGPADNASDEGRGMAELIHDVAPGADLLFHSAFLGQANFAQGILDLANAGADIIVDDVIYFSEPFFQDGIVAQAVDAVYAQGVTYFSSAGNRGDRAYEADFRPGGTFDEGIAHDFDPGPGVQNNFTFTLAPDEQFRAYLQWDEPYASISSASPGATSDYDIILRNTANGAVLDSSLVNNIGGDPFEFIDYTNETNQTQTLSFSVYQFSGQAARLKIGFPDAGSSFRTDNGLGSEFSSSTSQGHSNAEGALAIGAAAYFNTPNFGDDPAILNSFSSIGQTPILLDTAGNRLAQPILRGSPDLVGPDGGDTTFFGSSDVDGTGFPNFFGTSASAPHVAAVAALMLQANPGLTPQQIEQILESTAEDMDNPYLAGFQTGVDDATGAGFVRADLAVAAAAASASVITIAPGNNDQLEGDTGTTAFTFTVSRSDATGSASVGYSVSGADVNGADFGGALPTGTVQFSDGEATATITVGVSGDTAFELDETFTVTLSNPSGGTLGDTTEAMGVIRNDDPEPTDLSLALSASEENLLPGETVELVFALTNDGPDPSENVSVAVGLPAGLDIGSFSAGQGSFNANTGIWTVGTLSAVTRELRITATVTEVFDTAITGEVITADTPDRDSTPGNNNPNEDDQTSLLLNIVDPQDNYPTTGSDMLLGTNFGDFIDALSGNDTVYARLGNDIVLGGAGNDMILGGAGGDFLLGNTGNDTLLGEEGDDYLDGDTGTDRLDGGAGDDRLVGGGNNDTYVFALGYDNDIIVDSGASTFDVLELTGGLTRDDVSVVASGVNGEDAVLTFFGSDSDSLTIQWHFRDDGRYRIEQVRFDDGSTANIEDLVDPVSVLFPNINVTVRGTSADDTLTGTTASDVFFGGRGDDTLIGLNGGDLYLFAQGDGNDIISDTGATGDDAARISNEVALGSIALLREGPELFDLRVTTGGGNSILIEGQFDGTGAGVEFLQFDVNGTLLDRAGIRQAYLDANQTSGNDIIDGFILDDILNGGNGNDLIRGGQGSDTYLYAIGDDNDTIVDTGADSDTDIVDLLAGIDTDDVTFRRNPTNGNNLDIVVAPGTGVITVVDQFSGNGAGIEQVRFADGTIITRSEILFEVDDSFNGFDIDFDGTAGDDTLTGTAGPDVLRGRTGNDVLNGLAGNDTYLFAPGDGQDTIRDAGLAGDNADTIIFGLGIGPAAVQMARGGIDANDLVLTIGQSGDRITVEDQFLSEGDDIDRLVFSDGTVIDHAGIRDTILAAQTTDGDDVIDGFFYDDVILGAGGNDTLRGLGGEDTLRGGEGADTLDGGVGSDLLQGEGGDDLLIGILGEDVLNGGAENDTADVSGTTGNVAINLGSGTASVNGSSVGGLIAVENVIAAGAGDHSLTGSAVANRLETGSGDDTINGGAGDDFLAPGLGANNVDGGTGIDTVVLDFASNTLGEAVIEADRVVVTGPDGAISEWRNVEFVAFSDVTIPIDEIEDISSEPILNLPDVVVVEPAVGFSAAVLNFSLSEPAEQDVTFSFRTEPGTAANFIDYFPRSGTNITIDAGDTSPDQFFAVQIRSGGGIEPPETFSVRVFDVTGAVLPGGVDEYLATVTILDSTTAGGNDFGPNSSNGVPPVEDVNGNGNGGPLEQDPRPTDQLPDSPLPRLFSEDVSDFEVGTEGYHQWDDGAVQVVELTNETGASQSGWVAKIDLTPEQLAKTDFEHVWNADYVIDELNGDIYFTPLWHNEELAAGETTHFGFEIFLEDTNIARFGTFDVSLVSEADLAGQYGVGAAPADLALDASDLHSWQKGAVEIVTLENMAANDLDGWAVRLDLGQDGLGNLDFEHVWNAEAFVDADNGQVFFFPLAHNAGLAAGEETHFGMEVDILDDRSSPFTQGDFVLVDADEAYAQFSFDPQDAHLF